jgi:diguanylate cyclase (GGDEF)-like protein/PAS domain S-box-containing protein
MLKFRYLVWLGHDRKLPTEIYTSLVASLFSDPRTLLVGGAGSVAAALISAWKTGDAAIMLCTAGIVMVTIARAFDMSAFGRVRGTPLTRSAAAHWELRYVAGAAAFMALLGAWCFFTFSRTDDHVVQLLAFSILLANMIGVAGRNFGSKLLVNAQLVCAGVPMMLALFMRGNAYLAVLGCVLIPFFISLKSVADRLRRTLLDAVVATRDVTLLAGHFDTALNNMPHGLCMFDPHHRLVVANKRVEEMLGLSAAQRGDTLREFLHGAVDSRMLSDVAFERLLSDLDSRLSGQFDGELAVNTEDGRALELTFEPMPNGGSVVLVEDVTERRNAEAKINHLARYDALTGLPNRIHFHDQTAFALASMKRGAQCAVLFVDLDQFKQVNDTLGHPAGDALLCAVSQRLRGIVRDSDLVARFGGDEFVVLQTPIHGDDSAGALARRIVDELSTIYDIDGHSVVIGASVGIAVAPRDGMDPDLLLKNADMALYRAKSEGRGQWRFFAPEMDEKVQARRSLEFDLRQAVSAGAFELHYQPLVNLKTGKISTCEALLRWTHPERGPISPAEFIPIAEEIGLIVEIGHWVLRRACLDCVRWPGEVNVAVNLSPIQFRHSNIVRAVKDALAAANLPASRLEIEITESVLLQDTETTRAILRQMHDHGVKVSLDDFGTGYSSLSYLHSFPLDKVKIDRSFLSATTASKRALPLLRNVARLIAELGMWVTMEGVETKEQLDLITAEGNFDEAQGYLFSPAVPAPEIEAMLDPASLRQLLPKQARKVA